MNTIEKFHFLLKNKDIYSYDEYNNMLENLLKEHREIITNNIFKKSNLMN